MKTCILGLMLLGVTNLTFSQNEVAVNAVNSKIEMPNLTTTTNATVPYINGLVTNEVSKRITAFQNEVSKYDITTNAIYTSKKNATYTVVFKEANNVITNVYNQDGEAIRSIQKFEDIRLPNTINAKILKNYPNWFIKGVNCTIKSDNTKDATATYKVKISNGTKSKTIKIID